MILSLILNLILIATPGLLAHWYKFVKCGPKRFNLIQTIIEQDLPPNIPLKDVEALIKKERGPGTINMACVANFCKNTYTGCLAAKNCKPSVDCVKTCGEKFDTLVDKSDLRQYNLKNCYNSCSIQATSKTFKALTLCAQFPPHGGSCIRKFDRIPVPIPDFVSGIQLQNLTGNWSIVAGINPGRDRYSNSSMTIFANQTVFANRTVAMMIPLKPHVFKKITGVLSETRMGPGIYSFRSQTAKGVWYNLGTSDENTMVIYYTASNQIENWFGGYILRKKGFPNNLSTDDLPKIISILNRSFSIPLNSNAKPKKKIDSGKRCSNPLKDKCNRKKGVEERKCCIRNNQQDIADMKFTCQISRNCAAWPRAPPMMNSSLSYLPSTSEWAEQSFSQAVSNKVVTIDSFQLLNQ